MGDESAGFLVCGYDSGADTLLYLRGEDQADEQIQSYCLDRRFVGKKYGNVLDERPGLMRLGGTYENGSIGVYIEEHSMEISWKSRA